MILGFRLKGEKTGFTQPELDRVAVQRGIDYGDDGLAKITSPTGETLQYGYDDLGNLAKVTYGDRTLYSL